MKINIDESIPLMALIKAMASAGLVLRDVNGELWVMPENNNQAVLSLVNKSGIGLEKSYEI